MGRDPAPAALRLFDRFFLPWMRTRIDVRIAGLPTKLDPRQPLILIANHVSWWDGFLLHEVHRALRPLAPFHTVMLESELRQHRLLRSLGAVGILEEAVEERIDGILAHVATHGEGAVAAWPPSSVAAASLRLPNAARAR
jgi:hypothetical protein